MTNKKREEIFARYIIDNRATVRKAAGIFNASKSAVHTGCNNTENFCIEAAQRRTFQRFCAIQNLLFVTTEQEHNK